MMKGTFKSKRVILTAVLLVAAILSMALSSVMSSPKLYRNTYRVLDDQKTTVGSINIAVTTASTLLSTLPDDTAGPVADELADLTLPLFLIVCVIYLEKFLLTTLVWISFMFLIPIACILGIVHMYVDKASLIIWIKKMLIISLAFTLVIPCSTFLVDKIDKTYQESLNATFSKIEDYSASTDKSDSDSNKLVEFFTGLKDSATELIDTAKELLDLMIDAIAVLFIMNFLAPVLTVIAFIWIIKYVLGLEIPIKTSLTKVWDSRKIVSDKIRHRDINK